MSDLSYRMSKCTCGDIEKITAVIKTLRGRDRADAEAFLALVKPKGLCLILHSMRRWYSAQAWTSAQKLIEYRDELQHAMDLRPPIGAFRGFKIVPEMLGGVKVGDVVTMDVWRNGKCSSWTRVRSIADRFSGASKGKIGLVVKLAKPKGITPFIAPPSHSAPWFNRLYERTMGTSFRVKEHEFALCGDSPIVEIVRIKR